ncbi:MAG: hypothetical protein PHW25_05275 [Zoogloea sp.]|uniref:hypothetical protein n=1 Tax=Zoogloea sp. TaxID=49181 RepID=UPI00263633FF|nr:hypothetical protein [Zoogloea sp.]MDD3326481.1 hypothetical protein [Zoogloea sp.]
MKIEFDGPVSSANASTLSQVIEALLARIQARDTGLDLALLTRIIVTDQLAATEQQLGATPVAGEHLSRIVADGDGLALLFDGARLWQTLEGDGAEIARLIHHLHKECWRLHDARAPQAAAANTPLARALAPIVAAMWQEYRINRRSAWSLPPDSDLLLNHLAALLQALPGGMQEEITLYFADQDLDGLFAKSLGRIAHLMQAVAHVQGYLDGMGQPLAAVSGEMHELVAKSFLSPIWLTTAQHLAAGHDIEPGELADVPLRRDIHNAFATFGLQLREEDGDVWVDVQPIARPDTLH